MKIADLIVNNPVFESYLERFESYVSQLGYSAGTGKQMLRSLKEFLYWTERQGVTSVCAVSGQHLQGFYDYLLSRPSPKSKDSRLSQSHISSILGGVCRFYHYLQESGETERNPLDHFYYHRTGYSGRLSLTRREISRLYGAAESLADKAFLALFYGCGLRLSEGIHLKVRDISFADGLLYVRKGKGAKRRAVPLGSRVAYDLMSYYRLERAKVAETTFLLNRRNKAATIYWATNRIKYLMQKAGLAAHYSLHHLRHSIATHLLENGMKLEQVSTFLGHSHLESTQIYTRVDPHLLKP